MPRKKTGNKETIVVLKPSNERTGDRGDSARSNRSPKLTIGYHSLNLSDIQKNSLEALRGKPKSRVDYEIHKAVTDAVKGRADGVKSTGELGDRQDPGGSSVDIFHATDVNDLVDSSKECHSVTKVELTNQQLTAVPDQVWKANRLTCGNDDRTNRTKASKIGSSTFLDGALQSHRGLVRVLDLSCNYLKQVSSEIKSLPSLQILNLSNNQLTVLPAEIGELNELEEVHLCYNLFQYLPKILYKLQNLRLLSIKCNYVSTIDKELKYLNRLQLLDLSQNNLYSWPYPVLNSKTIVELNLSNNKISLVPDQIHNMKSLKFLRLRSNHIRRLPKMNKMTSLECIELSNNSIQTFPDFYGSIHLREIWLDHNLVQRMDAGCLIGTSTSLLSLSSNKLCEISGHISLIDTLTYLDVSNNNLKSLPHDLGRLERLALIKLEGNNFDDRNVTDRHKLGIKHLKNYLCEVCTPEKSGSIPLGPRYTVVDRFDPEDVVRYDDLQPCVRLTVDNTGHLPNWMFRKAEHDEVMRLDLSDSQQVQIPSQLWKTAPFLEELFLARNCLLKLPAFVGHFLKLRVLDLESNNLSSLPQELANCSELYFLNISHNKFTALPPVVFGIKKLQIIYAKGNHIAEITSSVDGLENIRKLDVSKNHISISQVS